MRPFVVVYSSKRCRLEQSPPDVLRCAVSFFGGTTRMSLAARSRQSRFDWREVSRHSGDTKPESLNASKAKVPFENEHFWKQKRADRDQPESAGAPRIEDVGHPLPAFSDASGVGSAAFCYHEETRIVHQSDSERRSTP